MNLPVFLSTLPGYFLSLARLTALMAVAAAGFSRAPVMVAVSAAGAAGTKTHAVRSASRRRDIGTFLSALVGGQVVLVDVQDQRRHGRRVDLVRLHVTDLSGAGRHVPAAIVVLAAHLLAALYLALQEQLADARVPVVPLLAAGLVHGLDGVIVEVVEVLRVAATPVDRKTGHQRHRLAHLRVVVLSQELHGQDAGCGRLWPRARAAVAEATRRSAAGADILDGALERLLGDRDAG